MESMGVYEQLVARKDRKGQNTIRVLSFVIFVIAGLVFLYLGMYLFLGAVIVAAALVWNFVFVKFHVEHEYTLVGSDIQIDVIYSMKKRKKIAEADLNKTEASLVTWGSLSVPGGVKDVYDATSGENGGKICRIAISDSDRFHAVLIEPNEHMWELMKRYVRSY